MEFAGYLVINHNMLTDVYISLVSISGYQIRTWKLADTSDSQTPPPQIVRNELETELKQKLRLDSKNLCVNKHSQLFSYMLKFRTTDSESKYHQINIGLRIHPHSCGVSNKGISYDLPCPSLHLIVTIVVSILGKSSLYGLSLNVLTDSLYLH